MSWWSAITALFRPAKELVEVFKPNAENEAERSHVERLALSEQDMASLQQFAAEFQAREGRTWWDSLVDGLNRLPRPLITLGILAFFVLAPLEPVRFLEIAAHGTTVIGSPPYMAPEQFEGRAVFASDVYSLGVTMYQMMTGVLPYETPTPAELDQLRRGMLVSSARLKNPAIPPAIDEVILRALRADVATRYQRAEDLLMGAPSEVSPKQLRELHIRLNLPEKS